LLVTLEGTASGGAISDVAIAGMGKPTKDENVTAVATAVRDSKGENLKVTVWSITKSDPDYIVAPWAEKSGGKIDGLAISSLTPNRLVTVNRAKTDFRVIVWDFSPGVLQRKGYDNRFVGPAEGPINPTVAVTRLSDSRVITACFDESALFMVCDVNASGQPQFNPFGWTDWPTNPNSEIAITSLPRSGGCSCSGEWLPLG
jgi:hypothetical protein